MRKTNNSINDSKHRKRSWQYLTVEKWSALLHGITSKHDCDFYCLKCLPLLRTENKVKFDEEVHKSKDFCGIVTAPENDKILKFYQYIKSSKMTCIIYVH